jgi:hypothetical protein
MSETQSETQQGCPVTVEKSGSGDHYDVFVHYGGAKFRISTMSAPAVDADIAEAQAASSQAQQAPAA